MTQTQREVVTFVGQKGRWSYLFILAYDAALRWHKPTVQMWELAGEVIAKDFAQKVAADATADLLDEEDAQQ